MILHRNETHDGRRTWHATERLAREAARTELRRGAPPFAAIAAPVGVPTSRKGLAALLNSLDGAR